MDAEFVAKQLSILASDTKRSKSAQLRDLIEPVENAIRSGVRYEAIIEVLEGQGLHFTYDSFALTLKRIRKARKIAGQR